MRGLFLTLLAFSISCHASPTILAVFAHPDDEVSFAGAAYALVHEQDAEIDVVIITNGEGGYKYSKLAEPLYGLELTDEGVGRKHLPAIRRQEALRAGKILGIRRYFFLGQQDHRYTRDMNEVCEDVWDITCIRRQLQQILCCGYDYLVVMLPVEETHGHHKAASVLALEAAAQLSPHCRPTALGAALQEIDYQGLPGSPVTEPWSSSPIAFFDRTQTFGFNDRLDYQIVVNWFLAEHKSQGSAQKLMGRFDCEYFYAFAIDDAEGVDKAAALLEGLGSKVSAGAPNT